MVNKEECTAFGNFLNRTNLGTFVHFVEFTLLAQHLTDADHVKLSEIFLINEPSY